MPTTRGNRTASRRAAATRTVLQALDENNSTVPTDTVNSILKPTSSYTSSSSVKYNPHAQDTSRRSFKIPAELDGTSKDAVRLLLEDLEGKVKQIQDEIAMKERDAIQALQEVYYVKTMKIEKKVKKMTIREFNETYMKGGISSSDNDGGGEANGQQQGDILNLVKSLAKDIANNSDGTRGRYDQQEEVVVDDKDTMRMELETPARNIGAMRTPATITRTVKRGEILYSKNGSPVDNSEEGDLVATVAKKRRGGGESSALFDINVGAGRYISLSDPSTLGQMDDQMKNTAKNQLKTLQDQMSRLMAQLEG